MALNLRKRMPFIRNQNLPGMSMYGHYDKKIEYRMALLLKKILSLWLESLKKKVMWHEFKGASFPLYLKPKIESYWFSHQASPKRLGRLSVCLSWRGCILTCQHLGNYELHPLVPRSVILFSRDVSVFMFLLKQFSRTLR